METARASRRVGVQAAFVAIFVTFVLDVPWNPLKKLDEVEDQTSKDANTSEEEANKEDEDVQIPDEMPEDAFFIPLGPARQLPQTFYKGTDPEWQSFIEFSKDKKRNQAVRSMYDLEGTAYYLGGV